MQQLKKILFIVNPIAGGTDKSGLAAKVERAVELRNLSFKTYKTTGTDDELEIALHLKAFKPQRVIVAGGDGTIKIVATALKGTNIPLAIIPAGSANGMVENLYFPDTEEEQIELAFSDNTHFIDLLKLNDQVCMHIADLGVNAELVKKYEEGTFRGKLGYALKTIPTLWESNYPFEFEITVNEVTYKKEGVLLAFANARHYGTGASINPLGNLSDGKFEIVLFKEFNIMEILKTLGNNDDPDPEVVEIIPAKSATVLCRNAVPFQIDGEYMGEVNQIKAEVFEEKLLLVVPPKFKG